MKNFSSWLECLTSARRTAEYALFFHPVWITHDLVRLPKINWYFLEFFQFPGIFSSILQWNNCPIRFFGRFSSVYQWNIKRNFSLDVFLFTLPVHKRNSSVSSLWMKNFSSWLECLILVRWTAEYALIWSFCRDSTRFGPIAENQLISLSFSSFLECFLLFFNEILVLSVWKVFFSLSMKYKKRF